MLVLLSPAKKLDFTEPPARLPKTKLCLPEHVATLSQYTQKLKRSDLKRLMSISDALADLNFKRFQAFDLTALPDDGKQAVLSFNGDVYLGLDAASLSEAELEWAQSHLRILSGLYGMLRPLDAILPYRLEMGVKLKSARGESLYDFWKAVLTDSLNAELKSQNAQTIINLASNEYFGALDKKTLEYPVITIKFHEIKDGKRRAMMLYAKRARGLLARYIIQNQLEDPEAIKTFNSENYSFDKEASTDNHWVFSRPQPPSLAEQKRARITA